ncbi:MAG: hypothetical protein V1674_04530 [Candidatus Omnitrophota bacterium]
MRSTKIIVFIFLCVIMVLVWMRSCAVVAKKYGAKPQAENKTADVAPLVATIPSSKAATLQVQTVSEAPPNLRTKYTKWGRSPFVLQKSRKFGFNLNLAGVLWDKDNPQAIINGRIVGKGDEIEGFKVIEITKDKVILSDGANRVELRL